MSKEDIANFQNKMAQEQQQDFLNLLYAKDPNDIKKDVRTRDFWKTVQLEAQIDDWLHVTGASEKQTKWSTALSVGSGVALNAIIAAAVYPIARPLGLIKPGFLSYLTHPLTLGFAAFGGAEALLYNKTSAIDDNLKILTREVGQRRLEIAGQGAFKELQAVKSGKEINGDVSILFMSDQKPLDPSGTNNAIPAKQVDASSASLDQREAIHSATQTSDLNR